MSYGSCQETLTQHQDVKRTGAELCETQLTASTLKSPSSSFGLLRNLTVDEKVFAQPLLVNEVSTSLGTADVVYIATMNNTIYAFPQNGTDPIWTASLGISYPYANITGGAGQDNNIVNLGILGTPVVDKALSRIYAVAAVTTGEDQYAHQLHAFDLGSGQAAPGSPITIAGSIPGNSRYVNGEHTNGKVVDQLSSASDSVNGNIIFDSRQHLQRPALLVTQDQVIVTFGSHVDQAPYHGFLIGASQIHFRTEKTGDDAALQATILLLSSRPSSGQLLAL